MATQMKPWLEQQLAIDPRDNSLLLDIASEALSLYWQPTQPKASLSGWFTPRQLREIADHIDKYRLLGAHENVNTFTRS